MMNKKDFDKKCTMHNKPSANNFPQCGPSGIGNLSDISCNPQKADPGVAASHFGTFATNRRRLAATLQNGAISTFTTEDQIR